jgi:hypothetical protein
MVVVAVFLNVFELVAMLLRRKKKESLLVLVASILMT